MKPNKPETSEPESVTETAAVGAFAADLKNFKKESEKLGNEGLAAMTRITHRIVGGDSGGELVMRSMLLSIFGAVKINLSEVGRLDGKLREDLCAVIRGVNHGSFDDFKIREILITAGDTDAKWFFAGVPPVLTEDVG
jgi:hypothetical protein